MNENRRSDALSLHEFRTLVINRLSGLWSMHVRNLIHGDETSRLLTSETAQFDAEVASLVARGPTVPAREILPLAARCRVMRRALALLLQERQQAWRASTADFRSTLLQVNRLVDQLELTLVDKDLLERQSQVLRNIILSHERVAQWTQFIQEILSSFHRFFPFNLFFIAFAEEHGLALKIYFMGSYQDQDKADAREHLALNLLRQLGLPEDTLLEIEEFDVEVTSGEQKSVPVVSGELISVSVPDSLPDLEGVLGVGYASARRLGAKEREILRSILSVMVLVVGSSKALSRSLAELEYHAVHDALTGLHNRRYFNDMLLYEIDRCARHERTFALVMIDLDNFKDVNDSYGHPCGDEILKLISELLRTHVARGDVLARLGGDEFGIMLTESSRNEARGVVTDICQILRNHALPDGQGGELHLSMSAGVAVYPEDGRTGPELLSGADVALYRAKDRGKDRCEILSGDDADMRLRRRKRNQVERFRIAIRQGEVLPFFHSIVHCKSGTIHAYEVLARMVEPDGTVTAAGRFIDAVEQHGLARDLDHLMIERAMETYAQRFASSKDAPRLFINLSAEVIQDEIIIDHAEYHCKRLGIAHPSIVFELTERKAIDDMTNMRRFLSQVRRRGFRFALDDFGSGYNSFHYLRELEFDYVKIDGAFIRHILDSRVDRALVGNLGRLCHELNIATIAEFVESEDIQSQIQEMGIDFAQGFHLSVPRPQFD